MASTVSLHSISERELNVAVIGTPHSGKSSWVACICGASDDISPQDFCMTSHTMVKYLVGMGTVHLKYTFSEMFVNDAKSESKMVEEADAVLVFISAGEGEDDTHAEKIISAFKDEIKTKPVFTVYHKSDLLGTSFSNGGVSSLTFENWDRPILSIGEAFLPKEAKVVSYSSRPNEEEGMYFVANL